MTEQTVFVRKYDEMAIIISITDASEFKDLFSKSLHESPDMLTTGILSKSIYSNMMPTLKISNEGKCITEDTRGASLDGIITGGSSAGPIWWYKKVKSVLGGLIGEE